MRITKTQLNSLNAGGTSHPAAVRAEKPRKRNKYGAKKTVFDGIVFDSLKECRRYQELKLQQKAGLIADLELQPEFLLLEGFTHNGKKYRKTTYKADFKYLSLSDEKVVVEDVKSKATRTPVYMLKKKLLLSRYPEIIFLET